MNAALKYGQRVLGVGSQLGVLKIGAYKIGNKKKHREGVAAEPPVPGLGTWNKMQLHFAQKFNAFTACPKPSAHCTIPPPLDRHQDYSQTENQSANGNDREMEGQRVREKERESGKADTANSQLNGGSLHFCSEFIISPACPYSAYFLLPLPATHIIPYAHTHTARERGREERDSCRYR